MGADYRVEILRHTYDDKNCRILTQCSGVKVDKHQKFLKKFIEPIESTTKHFGIIED